MDHLLRAKNRTPFFVAFALSLGLDVALYFLIAYLQPTWHPFIDILRSLAGSLVATVLVGGLIVTYFPDPNAARFAQIQHHEITESLTNAAKNSGSWHFRGGTGRFLRAETLPALMESIKSEHKHIVLNVALYDPQNVELCERYAKYRRESASELEEPAWNCERVQLEIYATLFEIYRTFNETDSITLQVALSQTMSLFRYDISDQYAIATTEGRRAPAIRADAGTPFYDAYKRDLIDHLQQSRKLAFSRAATADTKYEGRAVAGALSQLALAAGLSDSQLVTIAAIAKKKENPYA